jgi:predicted outer membrane repeat protein
MPIKFLLIFISSLIFKLSVIAQENYGVVLDLVSDGSVSKNSCYLLSKKVNKVLISDGRYKLFDRKILPELLKQYAIDTLSQKCCDQHCLIEIGSLIGAEIIIGGKAILKDKSIYITLNMVDVKRKRNIQSITLTSKLSKKRVISKEIPLIVEMLIESETLYQQSIFDEEQQKNKLKVEAIKRRRSFFRNTALYGGAILAGSLSALICFYILDREKEEKDDRPLSMDDLPQRIRYSE